ncbi:unnamed protein product [Rotaria sordida]|uniref:BEACH domain-containing protein n=1 Tax=Rotaria sordida TaxID=392033 RepID=A0A814I676_9BILA|nr:unnamed protein product [Rotaria sordida]CAF4185825.1 unnamed protein product [Rotaria sordida]
MRPVLEIIQAKNNRLEQLINNQQQQITNINEQCQSQQRQIDELTTIIKALKDHNDISIKRMLAFEDLVGPHVDLDSYHPIPSNYAGFKWCNGAFMPRQHSETRYPNTGFDTVFKQGQKCVAFNFGCQPMTMRDCRNLNQYPIFSWVIADYESEKLDLNSPSTIIIFIIFFSDFTRNTIFTQNHAVHLDLTDNLIY